MARIKDFTKVSTFDAGDVLIKDGTNGTKGITAENMAEYVIDYGVDQKGVLLHSDVVDGLTSTDATVPLSAAQGKVLSDKVDNKIKCATYTYPSITTNRSIGNNVYVSAASNEKIIGISGFKVLSVSLAFSPVETPLVNLKALIVPVISDTTTGAEKLVFLSNDNVVHQSIKVLVSYAEATGVDIATS